MRFTDRHRPAIKAIKHMAEVIEEAGFIPSSEASAEGHSLNHSTSSSDAHSFVEVFDQRIDEKFDNSPLAHIDLC